MTVPETVTPAPSTSPAGAAWTVEQVTAELREAWLMLASASVLLRRTSEGSMHPELRRARRCGEEALDLAVHAERLIGDGLGHLRDQIGGGDVASIGRVVGSLNVSRTRFAEAAERVAGLPERLRAAGRHLRATTDPGLSTAGIVQDWSQAADHLGLLTETLTTAAGALASYADQVTGTTDQT